MKLKAITVNFRGIITTHVATHYERFNGFLRILNGKNLVCCYVSEWAELISDEGIYLVSFKFNGKEVDQYITKSRKNKYHYELLFGPKSLGRYTKPDVKGFIYKKTRLKTIEGRACLYGQLGIEQEHPMCTPVGNVKMPTPLPVNVSTNKKKVKVKAPKVDKGTAYEDYCRLHNQTPKPISSSSYVSPTYATNVARGRPAYIPRPRMPAPRHGGGWHWVEGHWRSGCHVRGHYRGASWVDDHWRSDTWIEGFWRFTPYY